MPLAQISVASQTIAPEKWVQTEQHQWGKDLLYFRVFKVPHDFSQGCAYCHDLAATWLLDYWNVTLTVYRGQQ